MRITLFIIIQIVFLTSCSDPLDRMEEGTYYLYNAESKNTYPLEFEMKKWNDTLFFDRLEREEGTWENIYNSGVWWWEIKRVIKIPLTSSDNKMFQRTTGYGYPMYSPNEFQSTKYNFTDVFKVKGGELLIFSNRGDLDWFLSNKVYDGYYRAKISYDRGGGVGS